MLKGRESLIRLVGKRRRFLPNRESLLSASHPRPIESSLNSVCSVKVADNSADTASNEVSKTEWVTCPVCGDRVRGDDYLINSHLDTCLARGSKRKLAQRTLLQLNFTPLKKVQVYIDNSQPFIPNVDSGGSAELSIIENSGQGLNYDKVDNSCWQLAVSNDSAETLVGDHKNGTSLSCEETASCNTNVNVEAFSGKVLETFIVGRKFSDGKELHSGMKVTLFRQPDNPKDSNAVKVLSLNSGCSKVLGYLPRGLSNMFLLYWRSAGSTLRDALLLFPNIILILFQSKSFVLR